MPAPSRPGAPSPTCCCARSPAREWSRRRAAITASPWPMPRCGWGCGRRSSSPPCRRPPRSIASAAHSLAPRRVGELMFPLARAHVEQVALVTDEAIQRAQQALWDTLRIVAEPGGAAAFAALHAGVYRPAPEERVGIVISGANTAAVDFGGPKPT